MAVLSETEKQIFIIQERVDAGLWGRYYLIQQSILFKIIQQFIPFDILLSTITDYIKRIHLKSILLNTIAIFMFLIVIYKDEA